MDIRAIVRAVKQKIDNTRLYQAVDLALSGKWEEAHRIVQGMNGTHACWIHAVLHKIDGDLWNSKYWYRHAARPFTEKEPKAELQEIRDSVPQ
ncbi:MAG: hypothetical protein WCO56_09380 [Verrucomicrobiota bacterium]